MMAYFLNGIRVFCNFTEVFGKTDFCMRCFFQIRNTFHTVVLAVQVIASVQSVRRVIFLLMYGNK